ncbi:MAG: alpha/beta hydrolase [Candidatus Omnitrophota bacterium]|nr:MAG: alpha/beta hydrolase [Candidatus Omnitrophota bacterium]
MKFFFWLVVFSVLFVIWVRSIERHSIYFPMKEVKIAPDAIGLPYEEVYFKTSDNIRLHSWFISNDKAGFTIIFCHGNAGNISHRLEKIALFYKLGLNVFIFDYRGYGKSEGSPSEPGLYKDVDAAYKYLVEKRKVPENNIILYGESIGGAVAVNLAAKNEVGALITEETFTSIKDMIKIYYPLIPHFIISSKLDSVSKIKNIKSPKLIIHSIDDEIVPFRLGEKLFDAAKPPKKFLKIRGSHNTCFLDSEEEFTEGIRSFLSEIKYGNME